jgi:hypothetical protein
MHPSEDDVAKFLAIAPDAGEGTAFVFLEVRYLVSLHSLTITLTKISVKGADTLDDAVGQYFENPNKYSQSSISSMSKSVNDTKVTKSRDYPPSSHAVSAVKNGTQYKVHTNAVIHAGNIRAQDEVCFSYFR